VAQAAWAGLLIGLGIAAVLACCNATVFGAARREVPDVRRQQRLRPRAAEEVVGIHRGLTPRWPLGADGIAATPTPLSTVIDASKWTWAQPVLRVGAAAAAPGALLAVIAGVGRTTPALARAGDLPPYLAAFTQDRAPPAIL
jgi:amino acid transporter